MTLLTHTCVLSWVEADISSHQPCQKANLPQVLAPCSAEDAKQIHCVSLSSFLGVCCLSVLGAEMATFCWLGDKRGRWHVCFLKANPLLSAVALCAFIRVYILNQQISNKPAWHLIIRDIYSSLYLKRELWNIFFCFTSLGLRTCWLHLSLLPSKLGEFSLQLVKRQTQNFHLIPNSLQQGRCGFTKLWLAQWKCLISH